MLLLLISWVGFLLNVPWKGIHPVPLHPAPCLITEKLLLLYREKWLFFWDINFLHSMANLVSVSNFTLLFEVLLFLSKANLCTSAFDPLLPTSAVYCAIFFSQMLNLLHSILPFSAFECVWVSPSKIQIPTQATSASILNYTENSQKHSFHLYSFHLQFLLLLITVGLLSPWLISTTLEH